MAANTMDIADPGLNTLDLHKPYDIMAIVNSEEIKIFKGGKVLQRIAGITPSFCQIIVEIWNDKKETEIEFQKGWENLQLMMIKDASYHGVQHFEAKEVHIFRVSTKQLNHRYIWLSAPFFWINPIDTTNASETMKKLPDYPEIKRCSKGEGTLRASNGSVFGKFWCNAEGQLKTPLQSHDIYYPYNFQNYEALHKQYHAIVHDLPIRVLGNTKRDQSSLFNA